jgi:hypothetical protein
VVGGYRVEVVDHLLVRGRGLREERDERGVDCAGLVVDVGVDPGPAELEGELLGDPVQLGHLGETLSGVDQVSTAVNEVLRAFLASTNETVDVLVQVLAVQCNQTIRHQHFLHIHHTLCSKSS